MMKPMNKYLLVEVIEEQKKESGECCQIKSIHQLVKENPTLTYRQVEKIMKEQHE